MVQFFLNNWQTILLIYTLIATVVFIIVLAFWVWIIKEEDEEAKLYPEEYEDTGGIGFTVAIALATSAMCAVMWIAVPVVMAFMMLYEWVQKTFPNLMGNMYVDAEEDDDND